MASKTVDAWVKSTLRFLTAVHNYDNKGVFYNFTDADKLKYFCRQAEELISDAQQLSSAGKQEVENVETEA